MNKISSYENLTFFITKSRIANKNRSGRFHEQVEAKRCTNKNMKLSHL